MHIEDLFKYLEIVYSKRFIDCFESEITSQVELIRSSQGSKFDKKMWATEARQTLRYAFFLRYYASFESHLTSICERVAVQQSLPIRLTDISAENFLKRVNMYLTRVAGGTPLERHRLWPQALAYSWIRNTIVHRNGQVLDRTSIPQSALRKLRDPLSGISLDTRGNLRMNRRFCYRAISHMARLLLDAHSYGGRPPIDGDVNVVQRTGGTP